METEKIITKADERKALEQIKKIVEGLGENSYVGTAFKGVFELAEENIEYDAAFSAKFYMEEYDKTSAREREWKEKSRGARRTLQPYENGVFEAKNTLATFEKNAEDFYKRFREQEVRAIKAEEILASKEDEIIRLKAKLYDLTVKE